MSQSAQLYRLQQIDGEHRQVQARLDQIRQEMREPEELRLARGAARKATEALHGWQKTQRDVNETLQAVRQKASQTEQRLYSGLVKNPKELGDLQLNVQALGRQRAGLEDELLEAMVMVDDLAEADAAAAAELAEREAAWQSRQAELAAERDRLAARQEALAGEREATTALIEPALLEEYRQLARRQRNGVAVAGLKGNTCQVCGVSVSGSTARAAELGARAYCDSCGRLLHRL